MTDKRPLKKGDHLYLVDGSGYLFRAYHALPPLSRKSDGLPTGAVAGFSNMLWKLLEDTKAGDKPTHLAVIFDAGKKTFRNEIYPQYKANRPEPPDDLIPQFPLVRDATRAFGVPAIEIPGFEADDLIATYARIAREAGVRVTIMSSDKDLMQLIVDGEVELLDPVKNKRLGSADVMEKFGVPPSKVVEVQALAGDSTDNVPGVRGIGVKTAAELINAYGDLETLLKRAGEIKQPKRRETLVENTENARISLKLVTLDTDVKVTAGIEEFGTDEPDPATLIGFLKTMEFASLAKRAASHFGIDNIDAIPAAADAGKPAQTLATVAKETEPKPARDSEAQSLGAPGAVMDRSALLKPIDLDAYETVTTPKQLDSWIARARAAGQFAIDTETTSLDPMQAGLCGVSLAVAPGEACYIPCGHRAGDGLDLGGGGEIVQMTEQDVLARLKPLLEDETVLKIAQNLKYDYLIFLQRGIRVAPFDDTMLISYVVGAALHGHGMDELSETASEAHADHVRRSGRQGEREDHLRLRAGEGSHALFRRRRRRDAAPACDPQGHDDHGRQGHGLRDAGAAAGAGAGRHGAGGHRHRSRSLAQALQRFRQRHGGAGNRHPQARRRQLQHRLAQAAGRNPVRPASSCRAARKHQDGRMVDRLRCARRCGAAGP